MKVILLFLWYRFFSPIWNFVPSYVHSLKYSSTKGHLILGSLRQRSPKVQEIVTYMKICGFTMIEGPPKGMFSFCQRPWVTCARLAGNCEDFARLWAAVLRCSGGRSRFLYTESFAGESRVLFLYSFGEATWLFSGPDLIGKEFIGRREELLTRYYGEETRFSVLF